MNIMERPNAKGDKMFFYYDYGREPGQRPSTGIFIYTKPKTQVERNHNKEALALIAVKKSQCTIESQAIGSGFIPTHKFKDNFLDYYEQFVKENKRDGNRHLAGSFTHFKAFLNKSYIAPVDITEVLCQRFRQYLLDRFNGDTPMNYFARFKKVLKAATKEGYYRNNPVEDVKGKSNASLRLKENLEVDEYLALLNTPCTNEEVREAAIFCCYTALRYCDVKAMKWSDIKDNRLTTRMIQQKTGKPVVLTLHPIAKAILEKRQKAISDGAIADKVFRLPSNNGCNYALVDWTEAAGIEKHITWSCFRLSFSILLQDKNVDDATVAYLLGHTSTKYVNRTYKRHRPKDQSSVIAQLPTPEGMPYFLNN
jgi:integrase